MHPTARDLARQGNSLTPQRKHRKMLKDGSSEVWPENVERLFFDGLQQYWSSPYANFTGGRSRWRNQFLVEHLKSHGVERTKKQVASHIQVLRNMWKGTEHFHLVAGGEDNELDSPQSPSSSKPLTASGKRPHHVGSPPGSAASFSDPDDSSSDLSQLSSHLSSPPNLAGGPSSMPGHPPKSEDMSMPQYMNAMLPPINYTSPYSHPSSSTSLSGNAFYASSSAPHVKPEPTDGINPSLLWGNSNPSPSAAMVAPPTTHNRIARMCVWSDSASTPLTIDVDTLAARVALAGSNTLPRVAIRVRIRVPPRHPSTPNAQMHFQNVHGFNATVALSAPWTRAAQCVTFVHVDGNCVDRGAGPLEWQSAANEPSLGEGAIVASVPASALTKARWLDDIPRATIITQRFEVDGEVLGIVIYDVQRATAPPLAELVCFQKFKNDQSGGPASPTSPSPATVISASSLGQGAVSTSTASPFFGQLARGRPPSLPCAMTLTQASVGPVMTASAFDRPSAAQAY